MLPLFVLRTKSLLCESFADEIDETVEEIGIVENHFVANI